MRPWHIYQKNFWWDLGGKGFIPKIIIQVLHTYNLAIGGMYFFF